MTALGQSCPDSASHGGVSEALLGNLLGINALHWGLLRTNYSTDDGLDPLGGRSPPAGWGRPAWHPVGTEQVFRGS